MVHNTLKLSNEKVLDEARHVLQDNVPLEAEGYVCTTDDLYNVLLGVAANRGTLQPVCTDWLGLADPETIRGYLKDQLRVEDLPTLQRQLNAALATQIPKPVYRAPRNVAMDFHDRPYYGKQPQDTALWVRCQAKDGTTRCYRIATAYVMLKDRRVTLAVRFVLPEDDTLTVLPDLLKCLSLRAIRVGCLFLDKGFNGIAILRDLTQRELPALIACTIRGKQGGTRALCQGPKSYRTTYTDRSARGASVLARARARERAEDRGRAGGLHLRRDRGGERSRGGPPRLSGGPRGRPAPRRGGELGVRQLEDSPAPDLREQLRQRMVALVGKPEEGGGGGFIPRTNAEEESDTELADDIDYLRKTWAAIRERATTRRRRARCCTRT